MGKRGPKAIPDPSALRLLQGGRAREPVAPVVEKPIEIPSPPVFLTGYALEEWNRVIEELYSVGLYRDVDQNTLAAYCMAFKRWRTAEEDLDRLAEKDPVTHAAMIRTTNGNAVLNPLLGAASAARRDMMRIAAEFGMTPSARTTIRNGGAEVTDPLGKKYGF